MLVDRQQPGRTGGASHRNRPQELAVRRQPDCRRACRDADVADRQLQKQLRRTVGLSEGYPYATGVSANWRESPVPAPRSLAGSQSNPPLEHRRPPLRRPRNKKSTNALHCALTNSQRSASSRSLQVARHRAAFAAPNACDWKGWRRSARQFRKPKQEPPVAAVSTRFGVQSPCRKPRRFLPRTLAPFDSLRK